ncbi:MAG TPA: hypothetical protein VIL69_19565, partial [Roseomonas sp.]
LRLAESEAPPPGPVEGADSVPPDVVDPPLADTGIMMASLGPDMPGAGAEPGEAPGDPMPSAGPLPAALAPETPGEAPAPGKPGGPGDMLAS